jgi:hypothetical protein
MLQAMIAAGWPKAIGPNNKMQANHNRVSLDGKTVDVYWTKGAGFFVWERGRVFRGKTRDEALLRTVENRQNGMTETGPNA